MEEIDDIHVPFIAWLHELEIPFVYHRPDRKSGIKSGWPDFSVAWMSRVVFIECKTPEGRLSKVQENVIAFIRKSGNRVEICRSVEECKEAVKNILCERGLSDEEIDSTLEQRLAVSIKLKEKKPETESYCVGPWKNKQYVFARGLNDSWSMIREASVSDIAHLPKLP